ncbi:putative damage-inducible protein DinB [Nocardioides albertanoniae]|uniref:Putative damage-inducible protein DinB n=1 Tax=Nocardioides albertanoniae TaxID=1175486 RepID=A0A543AB67_9ACTN|nr:DinB family protein [Nocardioides albertanoniae]TQL69760.1 putative damage-inducible protein DinB [Nocardioides albertanoniae]
MSIGQAGERELLETMVDIQRDQITGILEDLDDQEARRKLVPSLTTPLGLVRHATFVEKVWFHSRVAGVSRAEIGLPDTVEESFVLDADDTIESIRAAFVAACERSREIAAGHELGEEFDWRGQSVSLRFIYAHMIQELAHHAGHGDILVEQLQAARKP